MYEKFGQFINGKWGPSSDNGTYEVINPATEEVLGQASKATPQDVNEALNAAKNGLEIWKKHHHGRDLILFEKLLTR
jgi:succinate-semialdehyde dehydrogenase/glutarate-semialdehyde dehydrogenase